MYIAVNRVAGPGAPTERVIEGFKHAAPHMKMFKGYLGLELWTGEDGSMQAISRWESKEALDEYLNSDMFKGHHGGSREETSKPGLVTYYEAQVI